MKIRILLVVTSVLLVAGLVVCAWFFFGQSPAQLPEKGNTHNKSITIYDTLGNKLITLDRNSDMYNLDCWSYLEIVFAEMVQIIAEQENCNTDQAIQNLFTKDYEVYTAFDSMAFNALKAAEVNLNNSCDAAGAITDLNGNLLATWCQDTSNKHTNYASERRSPYSSFKVLSVYTPAVEQGVIHWSSMYLDSPYKQLKDDSGKVSDWPKNASGTYSHNELPVYEALRTSLNTVAVKCLKDLGISQSMQFLQGGLGIPLEQETFVIENYGEEEVVGNIALGYLESGITPVEMAGYYQMFANGGIYTPPKTIKTIKLADGSVWYSHQDESKQLISPATADYMNKLLQGVVADGGTGEKANCRDVAVAGKTGTGDDYADNWFVGVTPGYSLALWHGQHDSNQAAEMFAAVVTELYSKLPNAYRNFIVHQNLYQIAYCASSGHAFSPNCTDVRVGYYKSKSALPVCGACKEEW